MIHHVEAGVLAGCILQECNRCFFIAAGVYQVWNVLVSAAYPHYVVVDDEAVRRTTNCVLPLAMSAGMGYSTL